MSSNGNNRIKRWVPRFIRDMLRPFYYRMYRLLPEPPRAPVDKHDSELAFWRRCLADHGFQNEHYRELMLAVAGETDDDFLRGKIVGDLGCGPRGSLAWAKQAAVRVGIDVLVGGYGTAFREEMINHDMLYLQCTETFVPVCSGFFDVLFSINALDHVDDLDAMTREILRILKPGALFVASLNLNMGPTKNEPQRLTEELVQQHLLDAMTVDSYKLSPAGPEEDPYRHCKDPTALCRPGQPGYLWVRARRK